MKATHSLKTATFFQGVCPGTILATKLQTNILNFPQSPA